MDKTRNDECPDLRPVPRPFDQLQRTAADHLGLIQHKQVYRTRADLEMAVGEAAALFGKVPTFTGSLNVRAADGSVTKRALRKTHTNLAAGSTIDEDEFLVCARHKLDVPVKVFAGCERETDRDSATETLEHAWVVTCVLGMKYDEEAGRPRRWKKAAPYTAYQLAAMFLDDIRSGGPDAVTHAAAVKMLQPLFHPEVVGDGKAFAKDIISNGFVSRIRENARVAVYGTGSDWTYWT